MSRNNTGAGADASAGAHGGVGGGGCLIGAPADCVADYGGP